MVFPVFTWLVFCTDPYVLLVTPGLAHCFSSSLSSKVTLFIWRLPFFLTVDIVSLFPMPPFPTLSVLVGHVSIFISLMIFLTFLSIFFSWPITHSGPCCLISTYLWKSNFPPVIEFEVPTIMVGRAIWYLSHLFKIVESWPELCLSWRMFQVHLGKSTLLLLARMFLYVC